LNAIQLQRYLLDDGFGALFTALLKERLRRVGSIVVEFCTFVMKVNQHNEQFLLDDNVVTQ
jgi:hypothetical protein